MAKGFTIMELMLVIALMGIAFFVVIPRFEDVTATHGINGVVRTISADLASQKEKAISTQKVHSLYIDFEKRTMGVGGEPVFENGGADTKSQGKKIPDDVSILDVEWPGDVFQTNGKAQFVISKLGYVAHAAIHLEDRDGQITLILEPFLGRVKIYDGYVSLSMD